ncbi:hypothetical protein FACS1894188_01450 [Clostridia bacterium]|nr:hypothetical protein FACS1894188_01450 [Clostridia bacterium]
MKVAKVLAALICAAILLSSCGNRKEVKATNDELKQVVISLCDELEVAEGRAEVLSGQVDAYKKAQTAENLVSVRSLQDGTGRTQFVSEDAENGADTGKLTFPEAFVIEGLTKTPNTTRVIIGENVSVSPSENWAMSLNAGTVNLSHSAGINGVIKTARTSETLKAPAYNAAFDNFFKQFPSAEISYTDVFISDTARGRMAVARYLLDDTEMELIAIGMGNGGTVTIGVFNYPVGDVRHELVLSLLKTLAYGSNPVRVEN